MHFLCSGSERHGQLGTIVERSLVATRITDHTAVRMVVSCTVVASLCTVTRECV